MAAIQHKGYNMAITQTQICNKALGWLGSNRITSLDIEEDSPEWLLSSENFDSLRDAVLEEREWTFAVKRAILNPDPDDPVFGSETRFVKPSDSLRILTVHDNSVIRASSSGSAINPIVSTRGVHDVPQADGWMVEGNYILAGADTIYVRYNERVEEVGRYSSLFIETLAQRLAAEFALPLTESKTLFDRMWQLYGAKIMIGSVSDGMQGRSRKVRSQALIRRR